MKLVYAAILTSNFFAIQIIIESRHYIIVPWFYYNLYYKEIIEVKMVAYTDYIDS